MSPPNAKSENADWNWGAETVHAFDEHVREQLPFYDLFTEGVVDLVRTYLPQHKGRLVDLGTSTGNVLAACADLLVERHALALGLESSEAMATAARARRIPQCSILHQDVEEWDAVEEQPDVIVSFLTLGFIDARRRAGELRRWVDSLSPGGAFIAVERCESAHFLLRSLILAAKQRAGATSAAVLDKELALRGVLRPVPVELFAQHDAVEWCRYGDFAGFLIQRSEVA